MADKTERTIDMYFHIHINRKKYILSIVLLLLLIPLGRLFLKIIPRFPLLFPGCLFKNVLHIYCPGCGGTRAVLSLFKLHFIDSFLCHPLVLYVGISLCFFYIKTGILLHKNKGTADLNINTVWLWSVLVFILAFFVIRNLLLVFAGVDYLGELAAYW